MDVLSSIDLLDNLIVENTTAPATANMRNRLSHVREQVEALQTLYLELKNKHSVLENTSEYQITELSKKNGDLVVKLEEQKKKEPIMSGKAADEPSEMAVNILQSLFSNIEVTDGALSQEFGIGKGKIDFLLGELMRLKFVKISMARAMPGGRQINYYKIQYEGQKYLSDKGLV